MSDNLDCVVGWLEVVKNFGLAYNKWTRSTDSIDILASSLSLLLHPRVSVSVFSYVLAYSQVFSRVLVFSHVLACSRIFSRVLVFSRVLAYLRVFSRVLVCSRKFSRILTCSRVLACFLVLSHVLADSHMFFFVCSRVFSHILVCSLGITLGFTWNILGIQLYYPLL